MGIEGINHLKGDDSVESEQNVEGQQDESASPPPEQVTPPTPASEEPAQPEDDDLAPDADEPGDDTPDPEVELQTSEQPDQPDGVDQEG